MSIQMLFIHVTDWKVEFPAPFEVDRYLYLLRLCACGILNRVSGPSRGR